MIGLDTNVLVRYLVQDDKVQGRKAAGRIKGECTVENPGYINCVVMCELFWVLESCYKYSSEEIGLAMENLLKCPQIEVESMDSVWSALRDYRKDGIDFSDALIGEVNHSKGCEQTYTFDKKAAKLEKFRLL